MSEFNQPEFVTRNRAIAVTLDRRVAVHRQQAGMLAAGTGRLNLLAEGDSWFDYPLTGSNPLLPSGVVAQLPAVLAPDPVVLSLAHYGDTTTEMLGVDQRRRLIAALIDPAHGTFDALLFSGGGNDIAGAQFRLWLHDANAGGGAVNLVALDHVLGVIMAAYEDLVALRDQHRATLPIFLHAYDFALPTGTGVCGIGPWLRPSLEDRGWMAHGDTPARGAPIVRDMLSRFRDRLAAFANSQRHVVLVETQGLLDADEWANELHPTPAGFRKVAEAFAAALIAHFPGRATLAPPAPIVVAGMGGPGSAA